MYAFPVEQNNVHKQLKHMNIRSDTYVLLCGHRDDIQSLEIHLSFVYVTFSHVVYENNLTSKFFHRMYKEIHDYVLKRSKIVIVSWKFAICYRITYKFKCFLLKCGRK